MRRIGIALLAAVLAAGALAGCGLRRDDNPGDQAVDVAAGLSPEAAALTALGYESDESDELATSGVAPTATAEPASPEAGQRWRHRPGLANRVWLRRNLLHGEVVVQTDDGTRTVLVQRGEVTALSETELAVASSDGFTQTWALGDELRVIEARDTVDPQQLRPGDPVGVAGALVGDGPVARIVVIDNR
jgi:hypothetical protein